MPQPLKFGLHVGFLLKPSMHEKLCQVAKAQGCTMSDVIRAALAHHLTTTDNAAPNGDEFAPQTGGTCPAMAP